jgi:ribose transport system substrate-binding protein
VDQQVRFGAFDPSDALIEALRSGSCSGIVLQDPVQMGMQSVKTLVESLQGKTVQKFISTGESFATRENMDSEPISKLLKPPLQQ